MAKYLIKASYSPQGMKGVMAKGGTARAKAIEQLASGVGGSLEAVYFTFGADDLIAIVDAPNHEAMAAIAGTVSQTGGLSKYETVVLLSPDQIDAAANMSVEYSAAWQLTATTMVDKELVRGLLERYCVAMNEHRREDWLDCFADDAVQEDPVGSPANVGRAAIGRFFDANEVPVTLTVTDDPLVVGREVIGFFQVVAELNGGKMRLPRIIDHIVLTEDGTRIQSLRAFFDYAEMAPAQA